MHGPDWTALPQQTPRALVELLRRMIERDPRRRLHDVADARIVLEDVALRLRSDGDVLKGRLYVRVDGDWEPVAVDEVVQGAIPAR